jgi:elongation factor 3
MERYVVIMRREACAYSHLLYLSGLDHRFNTWIPREDLIGKGFTKLVQQFDDLEASREGAGSRDTAAHIVRKHLEDIGLDGDIAQYNEIAGLSGGKSLQAAYFEFRS